MAVLRVAHVWGDRVLDVQLVAGGRFQLDGKQVEVPANDADLSMGPTTLQFSRVEEVPKAVAVSDDRDWRFARIIGCLLMTGCALVSMFAIEVHFGFTDDESIPFGAPRLIAKFQPPVEVVKKRPIELPTQTASKTPTVPSKSPHKADQPLTAKKAGLLDALEALGEAKSIFAPGGIGPGLQAALDKLGGGPLIGDASGLSMGPRGNGPGNGDGLGIGGPGGFPSRARVPGGNLGRKIDVSPCCAATKISDGLSKDLIAKVIRRHAAEVKFCYEQTLQQIPDLAGKIAVLFVIDATGSVAQADVAESTLNDASVEACVLARVRRWRFPEPQGGGIVSVTHPWFFRPAGLED